ncbi:hypothetical protein OHA72_34420 [Dactylosporangium sp. NBC_01737]|uniref:hypothetical protein n=1 Tax=Dactylosporangium sp. NBC_01737 TaxID=2975959 RepID=UPI002E1640DB|nr:hypothetical protein OHA72_34420 [Dactylosporangium sp. NBC_01737]
MSSIASLYLLRGPDIQAFATSGRAPDHLRLQDTVFWSGYFWMYLLLFLDEQGVPVSQSRHDTTLTDVEATYFLLTTEHQPYLPQLDPATFDQAAFDEYLSGMGWDDFDEAPIAAEETLTVLRDQVAALTEDHALLIDIA